MARKGENIRKRADGRWEARIIVGYGADGKAVYKSVYAKTYGEVREKKRKLYAKDIPVKTVVADRKMTFGQLMDEWLSYTESHVKASTFAKYKQLYELHILPVLGKRCLALMTSQDMETYMLEMLRNGRRDGLGGLSPKTVSDILSLIKQAIRYGKEHDYPCPSNLVIRCPRQVIPKIQILSLLEQQILERHCWEQETPLYLGILLSLYSGLRIGEVCALRWGDYEPDRGTILVERTMMRIQETDREQIEKGQPKTKLLIDSPKSACSVRTIPLPSFLNEYLRLRRKDDSCYILTGTKDYLEPRNYYRKYQKIMDECGLGGYNYHALRHTFATRCVEKGFDVKSLSEILGHADVAITLRRYVHPTMEMKRAQMERLEGNCIYGQKNGHRKLEISEITG